MVSVLASGYNIKRHLRKFPPHPKERKFRVVYLEKLTIWWAFAFLAYIDNCLYNSVMSDTDVQISGQSGMEVGKDFVGGNKEETTYNYENTKETIESVTALLEELKQTNPLLSQAAELLFKEFDRRESRIDALISENRQLWDKYHELERALTISNENNNASLIRERIASAKIVKLEEDVSNCPSLIMKAAVFSLLVFAIISTPIIAVLSFLVYTG